MASPSSRSNHIATKDDHEEREFMDEPSDVNKYHNDLSDERKKKKKRRPRKEHSSHENEPVHESTERRPDDKPGHSPTVDHKSMDDRADSDAAPTKTMPSPPSKGSKKKRPSRPADKPRKTSSLENEKTDVQDNDSSLRKDTFAAATDRTGTVRGNSAPKQQDEGLPVVKNKTHMASLDMNGESKEVGARRQKRIRQASHAVGLDFMELGAPANDMESKMHTQDMGKPEKEEEDKVYKTSKPTTVPMGDSSQSVGSDDDRYASINDDVYNMFFLSRIGGQAFYYAAYVFILKMVLYSVLVSSVLGPVSTFKVRPAAKVLVVQFFILPVAIAMQEDLIGTFHLIANIKYCPSIRERNPDANQMKFYIANVCRGIDGFFSLAINYIVLLGAQDVLSMFLNFAALQFLTLIDNIALQLAANGHLSSRLEEVALHVTEAKLLKQEDPRYTKLDTIFFFATLIILKFVWFLYHFV